MLDIGALVVAVACVTGSGLAVLRALAGPSGTRRRFVARAAIVSAIAIAVTAPAALALARSRSLQLLGETVRRVESEERVVALTFDDGPTEAGGTRILDLLASKGVRATFFVTGAELEQNSEIGRRMVAEGHELGSHTFSHRRMLARSLATIRDEVERTDDAIRAAGYAGPIPFRAPYSHKLVALPYYLWRTGRTSISYDVEPESDPEVGGEAERIVAHVVENVRPGSIVLLHVMYPSRSESWKPYPTSSTGCGRPATGSSRSRSWSTRKAAGHEPPDRYDFSQR